jgi:hypothetical protein
MAKATLDSAFRRSVVKGADAALAALAVPANASHACAVDFYGCELGHNPNLRFGPRLREFSGEAQMSAHIAVFIEEMSVTWLKNAFACTAGAVVLVALFIVLP